MRVCSLGPGRPSPRYRRGRIPVHGFRSAFCDWAGDLGVEFELAEASLAQMVGNKVTRAYLRTTMLERGRKVMADWAAFLTEQSRDVRPLEIP
jgi:hypothetical protein